jgi:Leucine-rich repeat (LRR) protein
MSSVTARAEQSPRLQAGGTLNPRRHLYVERPQDEELLELLLDGEYVNLLTSRQMGKSSLMVRAAQALASRGVRTASIDLAAELGTPADAGSYFLGLLTGIVRDLRVNIDLETWWLERGSETVNQRLMRFFRDVVAEQIENPVVIFLDEIDSTLKLPYTDDLFTAIRGMHNERATVAAYERITFCLIGVATPNELIKDRRTTPYNVGRTLELRDFDPQRDDLAALKRALSSDSELGETMLERVLHWTGGHPYLTLRLCASLREIDAATPSDVDRCVEDSFRSLERVSIDPHFQQVLRFLENRLADGLATFNLYQRVLDGKRERDQTTLAHTQLKLSGLVKRDEEGCLGIRNLIYKRLFDRRWVESTKPRREVRTYKRYATAAGIVLVIGALVASGWIAYLQMQLKERRQLEALNVSIISEENYGGTRVVFPKDASQLVLKESVPLLKAVRPVTDLSLRDTQISDVALLANLPDLLALDLARTPVTEIVPLTSLRKLQRLDLMGTAVSDLSPLKALRELMWLDIGGTKIASLSPVTELSGLKYLSIGSSRFHIDEMFAHLFGELSTGSIIRDEGLDNLVRRENIKPILFESLVDFDKLVNLEWLDLEGTGIVDLISLEDLNLLGINLSFTPISDVSPIANQANLTVLMLGNTRVRRLEPLADLVNLQYLDLENTQIETFSSIADLTTLQAVNLNGTQIAHLAPLRDFSNLRALILEGTQVKDLTPLASLTHLQWLDLESTPVDDLAPLATLTNLEWLSLSDTRVADAAPLANLTNLQELNLSDTRVTNLVPLASLTNLQRLYLERAQVSEEDVAELKRALAARGNLSIRIYGP